MKKKGIAVVSMLLLVFLVAGIGYAESGEFAVALKAGTLGLGPELTAGITDQINARIGLNVFSYDYSSTESDIEYDFDLNLFSVAALVDWHPGAGGFRLSAGILINGNDLDAEATAKGTYTIGNNVYTGAQIGTLKGNIDFNSIAPYIGIGYGNAVGKDKRWSFVFDLGAAFQGSPDVTLTADGPISTDAAFQADLEKERKDMEDDIDQFKIYPVIAIGVSYKF